VPDTVAHVRRVHASEGDRLRAIRLEALSDPAASIAFLETRADAERRAPGFWTDRAIGAALSDEAGQFVAELGSRWVATATVLLPEPGSLDYFGRARSGTRALLVAVYVAAGHRGEGLLEALVSAAADWSGARGRTEIALDVHVDNSRAQAAYRRLGFVPTGETSEGPNGTELEMVRAIAR